MGERRIKACVEAWPECSEGEYNPACCRFPKSCSCDIYNDGIDPALLEDPPTEHHVGTLDLSGEGNRAEERLPNNIDPQAVEAATRAHIERAGWDWDELGNDQHEHEAAKAVLLADMRVALRAAYPAIRQQVAEEIAVMLDERYRANLALSGGDKDIPREGRVGVATGYQRAAELAREIGRS